MQPTTYLKLIAGHLPAHGQGAIDDSLRMLAQEALGTSQIHYIRSVQQSSGKYFYLALPSASLAAELDPKTPLAMALPGHPQHQGPGVYVLDAGVYKVAAIFDGSSLELVANEAELVVDFIAEQTLPVFQVASASPWRFQSAFTQRNQTVAKLTESLTKFSVLALALAGLTYGGLAITEGTITAKAKSSQEQLSSSLSRAVADIRVGSPLLTMVAQYHQRMSVVVRAGGWLDAYQVKNGEESYRMFVPQWVTQDYIAALGEGTKADRDPDSETLVILHKGKPVGPEGTGSRSTIAKEGDQDENVQVPDLDPAKSNGPANGAAPAQR